MLDETIGRLNKFSASKTPFVALLSYDTPEDDIVCRLDEADKFGLFFKFGELNLGESSNESADLAFNLQTSLPLASLTDTCASAALDEKLAKNNHANLKANDSLDENLSINSLLISQKNSQNIDKISTKPPSVNLPHHQLDYFIKPSPIAFERYEKAFNKVIEYMKSGDVYLLNLCFATPFSTNLSLKQIFDHSKAPLVVLLDGRFVCFTPEIFVEIQEDKITTFPMKGTISAEVKDAKNRLLNDEKEFSEQAMITDLMRNDLSMVSEQVKVDKFRYFTKISTPKGEILQTSTQISGRLTPYYMKNYGDLFARILPAGSISGTPKIRAQEIIKEVEIAKRGFYSGIFVHFDGKICQSYVLIRFVEENGGKLCFKSGGGITVQSEARREYDELLQKAYFTF